MKFPPIFLLFEQCLPGSDLQYFVNFNKYFPHPAVTKLPINYRSIKSIVNVGEEIIKNNSGLKIDKDTIAFSDEQNPINIYISLCHNHHNCMPV